MDVRKFVLSLGGLILVAVAIVLYLRVDEGPAAGRYDLALTERIDDRYGASLRALEVQSIGVDTKNGDVVVVFRDGARLGRKLAARLADLGNNKGCGEVDMGVAIEGEALSAWGNAEGPAFNGRVDCVIESVLDQAADLRAPQ